MVQFERRRLVVRRTPSPPELSFSAELPENSSISGPQHTSLLHNSAAQSGDVALKVPGFAKREIVKSLGAVSQYDAMAGSGNRVGRALSGGKQPAFD